jgi:Family of unknown function (DUF6084)
MPDLNFRVDHAAPVPYAAAPLLAFSLEITNAGDEAIHTIVLRCQIQIEPARRKYDAEAQLRLLDLFGETERWSQTLRNMHWTHAHVVVPSFSGTIVAELQVPCTFDFNVAATKYFYGIKEGDIPLCLMFSGSVFYEGDSGALQVAPIAWEKEARFRLPCKVWHDMMDVYYPNSAWLSLRRDAFDRLSRYKTLHSIPTWEQALERLVPATEEVA